MADLQDNSISYINIEYRILNYKKGMQVVKLSKKAKKLSKQHAMTFDVQFKEKTGGFLTFYLLIA